MRHPALSTMLCFSPESTRDGVLTGLTGSRQPTCPSAADCLRSLQNPIDAKYCNAALPLHKQPSHTMC